MTNRLHYRMPDGAEIVSVEDDIVRMHISMPSDDAGYFGRECPACERLFRMQVEDYKALADDQQLTCPYCAAVDEPSKFFTKQQIERARAAAGAYAMQMADDILGSAFRRMAQSINSQRGMIRMEVGSSGIRGPQVLPAITEEAPIHERTCARCSNRYAVFGEHIACPVCGKLPPQSIALDALDAQEAALSVFDGLPGDLADTLRESGALDRTAVGALGSVVSIVEAFLKDTVLSQVSNGAALIAGKGNVFQRLSDSAALYQDRLGIDLPAILGAGWERLLLLYGLRNLVTHNNGVVDAKHVARFPSAGHIVGHRVHVGLSDAREAITLARTLVTGICAQPGPVYASES